MTAIIILILLGILLFLIEFFIIPGATVAGIGGLILMGSGVYIAFDDYGNQVGLLVLVFSLIASILILVFTLRSKTWKGAMLNTSIDGKVNEGPLEGSINKGDNGIALTRLAPIGKIRINDITMEGKSSEGYIDAQTKITVVKITGAQAIVKPIK